MKPRLVVIGNGMAGMRTVEELLKLAPDLYQITVFGAEPHGNYNRILLSPVLAGEMSLDEIMINTEQWYEDNAITLLKGKEVVKIDRLKRVVTAADGTEAPYDRLLLATGSDPIILPVSGVGNVEGDPNIPLRMDGILTDRSLYFHVMALEYGCAYMGRALDVYIL